MNNRFEAPLEFAETEVVPEWIDFNGHMNVAYYLYAFDRCLDEMYSRLGVGPEHITVTGCSVFTLEVHINYLREVMEGDPLRMTGRLLDHDDKRIHVYFEMFLGADGPIVAAMEQIGIHVDMQARKPVAFARQTTQAMERMMDAHRGLPEAGYAGRVIGIRRKR